jgi:hypothetical protein
VPNKKIATGRYAPTDKTTACIQDTTCVDDGTQLPSLANPAVPGANRYSFAAGTWGSCPPICKNGYFGPTCSVLVSTFPSTVSTATGEYTISAITGLKSSDGLFIYGHDGVNISCYISETIGSTTVWKKYLDSVFQATKIDVRFNGLIVDIDATGIEYSLLFPSAHWTGTPRLSLLAKKIGLKTILVNGVNTPHLILAVYTTDTGTILGHYKLNLALDHHPGGRGTAPLWEMGGTNPF